MELKPGTLLQNGKYEIRNTLGNGGFGVTYLAEHHMLNKLVCIKEFFPQTYYNRDSDSRSISLGSEGSAKLMEAYRNKFIKEARTIARLQHPNVISIYDVFEENNTAYYVMEYIEGDTLSGIVKRQGPMDEHTAREFIFKVADALDYIHKNNLLHLDIKPANVMVRRSDSHVTVIDFGLAKQYDTDGNQTSSTPVGISQGYAPPEQYEEGAGNTFTPATDVYALGATYYYITTGQVPPSASVIMDGGLPALVQHLGPEAQRVILGSLQPSRRLRPANIKVFLSLFETADTVVGKPQPERPKPQPEKVKTVQLQQQKQQQQKQQQQQEEVSKPSTHMPLAIVSTIFCSIVLGIIAIVKASQVNSHWNAGRTEEAIKASKSARTWGIVALVGGPIIRAILIFFLFLIGLATVLEDPYYSDDYYDYLYDYDYDYDDYDYEDDYYDYY